MSGSIGQPTQGTFAWQAVKSSVGTWSRTNDSATLGMGYLGPTTSNSQNDELVRDLYFDSVTWKFCLIYYKGPNRGIVTVQLDGATQGTIDTYAAGNSAGNYSEITGIAVTTPSAKAFKMLMASKNASAGGYDFYHNSWMWIATSGTYSTPGGTDTPGYTWEWHTWMGSKGFTGTPARYQASDNLGGGLLYNSGAAQNDEMDTDAWIDAGTAKAAMVYAKNTNGGIVSIQFGGVTQGSTIDEYAASFVINNYVENTGLTVSTAGVKNVKLIAATKNASSTGYMMRTNSLKVIRTGP